MVQHRKHWIITFFSCAAFVGVREFPEGECCKLLKSITHSCWPHLINVASPAAPFAWCCLLRKHCTSIFSAEWKENLQECNKRHFDICQCFLSPFAHGLWQLSVVCVLSAIFRFIRMLTVSEYVTQWHLHLWWNTFVVLSMTSGSLLELTSDFQLVMAMKGFQANVRKGKL